MEGFYIEPSPKLTKEFVYSKIDQERIMEHYLGVPIKKGLFVCPSHIRIDKKPTCSFYKNGKGDLMFKDFAGLSFNAIGAVMHIFDCSYYKALAIIANDFGLIKNKMAVNPPKIKYSDTILTETKPAKIQVELKEFSSKELSWWNEFGVTLEILKKFKVYSIKSIFLNGNYFTSSTDNSPIFGYYGGKDSKSDELWRLYFPRKLKYRFLSNWSSSMIQGIKQLFKSDHLIITKSLKDVMTLHGINIPAIAPNSENIVITQLRFNKLNKIYNNVFCLFDNDLPGVRGAQKYKKEYNITCIFIKRKYAKDISDLFKKLSYSNRLEAINELANILKDKSITNTKYFYVFNGGNRKT